MTNMIIKSSNTTDNIFNRTNDNESPTSSPVQNIGDVTTGSVRVSHISEIIGLAICFSILTFLFMYMALRNRRSRTVAVSNENDANELVALANDVVVLTPEEKEMLLRKREVDIQKLLRTSQAVQHSEEDPVTCLVTMNKDGNDDFEDRLFCQICMEDWQVGDTVAYSGVHCNHVFHFDCIESWLMQHNDCPYCRQTMLIVDEEDFTLANDQVERAEENLSYCIWHGLQPISHRESEKVENRDL